MIPILSATPTLTGNGIGRLTDAISCNITHEINGEYELRMRYPVTGLHYDEILQDRIVWAAPDNVTADQAFRIYRITRPMNGIVTIYARHIAYDMSGIIIEPFTANSVTAALSGLAPHAVPSCPFSFTTSRSIASTFTVNAPAALWSLLGGQAGSLLDVYGGEWDFDNYTAGFVSSLGMNRGVTIRYGKNLTQFEQDITIESTYAAVYPFWYDEETNTLVKLPEQYITITGATGSRVLLLDCAEYFETQPTEAQLRTRANAYINANDVGDPKISWKVNFAMLAQAGEYETQAILEQVQLGDTVAVYYEPANLTGSSRVVKTEYDALLERYNSVTLGRVKQNLAKIVADTGNEISKAVSVARSSLERAIDNATQFITNGTGYIRFIYNASNDLQEIVSLDTSDISTATKVWRWNNGGFGYSSNGYGGPYGLAITQDGQIVADYITTGTMAGNRVRTGLIADETGTNWWNLDTGELHVGALQHFGGRNILLNSATRHWNPLNQPSVSFQDGITVSEWGTAEAMRAFGTGGTTRATLQFLDTSQTSAIYLADTYYTMSVYIKNNHATNNISLGCNGTLQDEVVAPGEAKRVSVSLKGDGVTALRMYIRTPAAGDAFDFTWWHPKIEYGEVPTDWSPAPEDEISARIAGDAETISTINSEYSSQFEVMAEDIRSTVERMDTLSNGLSEQISTAVQQSADNLTVNITQAQQTANGIQTTLDAYFEFLATGLKIRGTAGSTTGSYLNLAADEVGLFVNSTRRLWLTASGANADYFNASEGVLIGTFIWEQYPGGIRLRKA